MADYTPRLSLRKPNYTDPESVIPDVNNNWDTIDDAINANLFTSITRPLNPKHGRLIYETDTKLLAIYVVGTGWVYIGGDGFARGKRAIVSTNTSSTPTGTVEAGPFISVSFTAEIGRRYWVETLYNISYTGGSGGFVTTAPRVRWAAGAAVTTAGTQLGTGILDEVLYDIGSVSDFSHQYEFVPNVNGQITVGLFMVTTDNTKQAKFDQNSNRLAYLMVRDVGV